MGSVGLVLDGAIAVDGGRVVATGATEDLRAQFDAAAELDLSDFVVFPGFVDAHTHPVFVAPDAGELATKSGAEPAIGRDLERVVRGVREADLSSLVASTRQHLEGFLVHGTTALEAKTGYGLDTEAEVKGLHALAAAAADLPLTVHRTFSPAHLLGPEQRADADGYARRVVEEMLPAVRELCDSCDVHVQRGSFDLAQARSILHSARAAGLGLRMLADPEPMRGVELGVELEVATVDHVAGISVAGLTRLAAAKTAAVLLPGLCWADPRTGRAPARALIDRGCAVALGSGFHPLGCTPRSMPLVMALARNLLGMTPKECVIAATLNAAVTLGLDHAVGSLHAGKRADFVALDLPSFAALGDLLDGGPAPLVVIQGEPVVANVRELEPGL